ncbi:MAG: hypothetical protein KatS3mg076_1594 [Candidatus Binatia bacterium]|nr:MAG: hypothetical protein KatS3mg076_1594 [Candidatus Binatia bacterium]
MSSDLADLIDHLERTAGLERPVAEHVLREVLAYFGETLREYVLRRHAELRREHLRNEEIFVRIRADLESRRFRAEPPSVRQLRRMVYG